MSASFIFNIYVWKYVLMENHAALKIISYILICLFHIYNNMLYYINVNPLYIIDYNTKRPQFMWDYSLNLSILMREGKEINKDSFSSGERKRKSPSLSPPAILVGRGCSVRNVYYLMRRLYVQVHLEWGHYTHRGCQARSSYNQYKKIFPKSRVAW